MDPVSVSIATSFDYAVPLDVQVPLIAAAAATGMHAKPAARDVSGDQDGSTRQSIDPCTEHQAEEQREELLSGGRVLV
ncbi:MAG: hypothetical protein M3069_14030 [Chloroflexota bacterium]|nr:hypothetical protein [Chloroflexota bacterium]